MLWRQKGRFKSLDRDVASFGERVARRPEGSREYKPSVSDDTDPDNVSVSISIYPPVDYHSLSL